MPINDEKGWRFFNPLFFRSMFVTAQIQSSMVHGSRLTDENFTVRDIEG